MLPRQAEKIEISLRRRLGKRLAEQVPLKDITALGVGGVADYYFPAQSPEDLMVAVGAARGLELPWVFIGSGSHSLMTDYGFAGLVIGNQARAVTFMPGRGQVIAESGVTWPQLILPAAGYGLSGAATLLALPGTLGGSLAMSLGTPETNPLSIVRQATVLWPDGIVSPRSGRGLVADLTHGAIILTATLQLIHTRTDQIASEIGDTLRGSRRWNLDNRRWLGPVLSIQGRRFPFAINELWHQANLSHLRLGNAFWSRLRPNYIEIRGRVTARELRTLISQIYDSVAKLIDESLTVHCNFLGNWEN